MSKPKLLRITTVPHSLNLLLKGQLRYMSENGFEVIMMCADGPEVKGLKERERCDWVEAPLTREFNVLADIMSLFRMIILLKRIKPDIVHTHSPKAGTIGLMAAWFCGVPLRMHTVAGLPLLEEVGLKRTILDFVEKVTYRCAHWVLPNSKVQAQYLIDKNYLKEDKVVVIGEGSSNGINLEYYHKSIEVQVAAASKAEEFGISSSDFVISFVGRLANYKGVNELVKAHIKLLQYIPEVKLILVGPFEELNPLDDDVKEYIENTKSIFTTGHVEDIRPYLSLTDVFVFPSYREGFPQSLMQAAAMGLPCVTTNINGCNEIIKNGENGFLVEPKLIDPIVNKVKQLYDDDLLRERMSRVAAKGMVEGYDQKAFWDQLLSFYKEHMSK